MTSYRVTVEIDTNNLTEREVADIVERKMFEADFAVGAVKVAPIAPQGAR